MNCCNAYTITDLYSFKEGPVGAGVIFSAVGLLDLSVSVCLAVNVTPVWLPAVRYVLCLLLCGSVPRLHKLCYLFSTFLTVLHNKNGWT